MVVAWALLVVSFQAFAQNTNSIPSELRQGSFSCDRATIEKALALNRAGWVCVMPRPKSPQAAWGNPDGRTTWWVGYWSNEKTRATSLSAPEKDDKGQLVGDGNGGSRWRRGGCPLAPSKIEWLCSKSGRVSPR
jgi:hypothetical protein